MSDLSGATGLRRALGWAAPWLIALAAIALVLVVRAMVVTAPLARLQARPSAPDDPQGTTAWIGSLALPHGGPFVIGFQSPGPARLTLAGGDLPLDAPTVLAGRGVVTRRLVMGAYPRWDQISLDPAAPRAPPATAINLRFAAPPGARLLWLPPGRRGEPEYIPAAALSPRPAEEARFDQPDRAPADAAAALAVVVIVLALAGWLVRDRVRAVPRVVVLGVLAVAAVALAVRLESLGAAGQTWDEDTYWSAGRNYIQNLLALDVSQDAWIWNYQHPPVSKYLAGLGAWWTGGYGPARAVSAIVMALACAMLVPIGARLHRPATGIVAGLAAALTPHLIAHGQIVGHEAPTALTWALALWASLRVWDGIKERAPVPGSAAGSESDPGSGSESDPAADLDHAIEVAVRRRLIGRLAVVGLILGVSVMVRFVNLLAAPAIGLTIVLLAPRGRRLQAVGLGLAVIPLVAALTSVVLWPRLWSSPIEHLDQAWDRLKGTHAREPFLGELTSTPPRWYFFVYVAATIPLGMALAAVGGVVAWARAPERRRALLVIGIWALAPMAVALSPVRQDGMRYVIPTLTALALLAAAGVTALADALGRGRPGRRWLAALPAAVLAAYLALVCVRIRPYYLDYYGEQVGGTATVARTRRFEVAWWGEGLHRAIAYVNVHAAPGARVHRRCVEPSHLTWFRGDLWEPVDDPGAARWLVHYQPSWRECPLPPGAVKVFTERAGGAPLVDVYRIDPPAPPPAAPPVLPPAAAPTASPPP